MKRNSTFLPTVACWLLTACAPAPTATSIAATPVPVAPAATPPPSAATQLPVAPTLTQPPSAATPNPIVVHFWISNQSLGTQVSAVQMTVSLDGTVIFDKAMEVLDQHNVAVVDKNASPGSHTVNVKVGNPYSLSIDKVVDITKERWIFARFWFDPKSAHTEEQKPIITIDVYEKSPGIK